jgi:hypothetical protein
MLYDSKRVIDRRYSVAGNLLCKQLRFFIIDGCWVIDTYSLPSTTAASSMLKSSTLLMIVES